MDMAERIAMQAERDQKALREHFMRINPHTHVVVIRKDCDVVVLPPLTGSSWDGYISILEDHGIDPMLGRWGAASRDTRHPADVKSSGTDDVLRKLAKQKLREIPVTS